MSTTVDSLLMKQNVTYHELSEEAQARECLSSAMWQRRLNPGNCCSMSKQFAVGQVLRELVVAVKSPLLCGAEHDERSPVFREPFVLKLMMLGQVGGVGESCHSARGL